jgi:hypothetical protein
MAEPTGTYLDDIPEAMRPQPWQPPEPVNSPEERTGTYLDDIPKEKWAKEDQLHQGLLKAARNNQRWDDIAPSLKQDFPEADQDRLKEHYKDLVPHVHMEEARKNYADKEETTSSYLSRHVLPGGSALVGMRQSQEYSEAQKRVKARDARPEDYDTIAGYERIQEIDRNRSFGGKVVSNLAHIPALVGEFAAGGSALKGLGAAGKAVGLLGKGAEAGSVAIPSLLTSAGLKEVAKQAGMGLVKSAVLTPLVPAIYAKEWAQKNMEQGRAPMDPWGLPPAYAMGVLQVGVLGGVAKMAGTVGGGGLGAWTQRLVRGTVTGMGGQEAVNVGASAVSELLPQAWKLDTSYGTIGAMVNGKKGEWAEHLSIQAITFAAFSSLHAHNNPNAGMEEMKRVQDALAELKAKSMAGGGLGRAYDTLAEVMKTNPDPTPDQVRKAMEALPEGPVRKFGMGMAEQFGEDVVPAKPPADKPPAQPTPEEAKAADAEVKDTGSLTVTGHPDLSRSAPGKPSEAPPAAPVAQPAQPSPEPVQQAPEPAKANPPLSTLSFGQVSDLAKSIKLRVGGQSRAKLTEALLKAFGPEELAKMEAQITGKAPAEAEPTGKPGSITSDLDQTTEALGMGKAVKEVPAEPEPAKSPEPPEPDVAPLVSGDKSSQTTEPQRWNHTGTKFTGERGDEFVGKDGRKYVVTMNQEKGALSGKDVLYVRAYDAEGNQVAKMPLDRNEDPQGKNWSTGHVETDKAHGGNGVAKAMYDFAHETLGELRGENHALGGELVRSSSQTEQGKAIWDANAKYNGMAPKPAPEPVQTAEPAKPAAAPPVEPAVPDAEAEELTDRSAAGKTHLDEVFKAADLNANERHILRERGLKRTLDDIAGDKELLKADGTPYKGARSSMKAIEKRAMGKIRSKFPDLPEDFTMAQLTDASRADEIAERTANGHNYNPADVQVDPVELKAARQRKLTAEEKAENRMNVLVAQIEKETKDAGGKLSAKREAELWAQLARSSDEASGLSREAEDESESEPGSEAGRSPVVKASVRSEASPGVQGGDKASGVADAVQAAEPPAPAHPQDAAAPGGEREAPGNIVEKPKSNGQALKATYEAEARKVGVGPQVLQQAFDSAKAEDAEAVKNHNEIFQEISRELGPIANLIKEKGGRYEDADSVPRLDEVAQKMERLFPGLFGEKENPTDTLFKMLKQGQRKPMSQDELYYKALQDVSRPVSTWQPDLFGKGAKSIATQKSMFAEDAARPKADEEMDPDQQSLFGDAREPEGVTHGGEPEPWDMPNDPIGRFLSDEAGSLDLDKIGKLARAAYQRLSGAVQHVRDNLAEFAGQMGPRMTRANKPSGEAMARFNAAPGFAREAAPRLITKVMGDDATPEGRKLAGAVITERRLRYMKEAFTKQGDQEAADAVKTIVGQPESPLASEADYQRELASPKMQAILDRWKQFMVPVMNDNYQRAEGLEDTDPIVSKTQIPDEPVNLKGLRSTDPQTPGAVKAGGGRGNLKNPKLGKLIFARKASGASDSYDVDLGAIIENSLQRSTALAAKAEWFRTMTENGVAQFGKPGAQVEGFREIPGVKPPKGTQAADPGETSLYVKDDVYGETRQALAVDEAARFPIVKGFNDLLTKAALASTTEAIYHSKNLMTMLFKPGVRVRDALTNTWKVMAKDPEMADRLVELARIGALKTEGSFESGVGYGKMNPLTWMGKFLDTLQRGMRLTAEDAFDRLQRSGRVEATETNKRDFINQLGQYNRAAQNKLVVLFRDTGLGPFATAGSNYYMQGLKSMTMNPGVKSTGAGAEVMLRAEMLAKTVSVLGVAALTNYLLHKRIDGDDNTPLGAVKLGDKGGKTSYFDLTNLTGLTRGMRQTGLLALAEGARKGDAVGKTVDRATDNAIHALIHPAMGPGPAFAHTLATGKNSIGMNVAEKPDKEGSHAWQNLKAALLNANPVVGVATGADRPKEELTGDRFLRLLGPYAPKERGPAKTPRTPHEWRQRTADILHKKSS